MPPEDPGLIIDMTTQDQELIWNTDIDGNDSDTGSCTLTPEFKRGIHPSMEDTLAIQQILQDSCQFTLRGRNRPSVLILSDSRLKNWPRDSMCQVEYHPEWSLNKWLEALKAEIIRVTCNTVILYFETTCRYTDVPPLKNKLQAICSVIQLNNHSARMFISNLLPKVSDTPVSRFWVESSFILLQAVRSVNQVGQRVHNMALFEHFTSSKECKIIKPTHKYFDLDESLTPLGCLVLQECILRESGLKSYWFD